MDLSMKHAFPDPILSSRRRVLTRFGLGIGASLVILTGLLLSNSFKNPFFASPFFQGFYNATSLSFSNKHLDSHGDANVSNGEEGKVLEDTLSRNYSIGGSSEDGVTKTDHNTLEGNVSIVPQNASLVSSDVGFVAVKETHVGNSTQANAALSGMSNVTSHGEENSARNVSLDGNYTKGSFEKCDIYDGRWVRVEDDSMPYYPPGSCPYIDRDFDCHINGRPDDAYVKWRWQPNGCDIPSLNATDFLEKLRGKKLVFVGDSINRNMWESLVCILRHGVKDKEKVYEISGRTDFKKTGFYAFRFEDYNCTVDYVSSPFLVRESSFKGKNGYFETLRLDLLDKTTSMYEDADILIFNTGHWWTHDKTKLGEDYYQEGDYVHPKLKVLEAFKRALTTWGRWIDKNIDRSQTHVIYRGYSVTHFRGGPWNLGGKCHNETEPIFNTTYLAKYPSKMRALEYVIRDMKTPVIYMNISRLTDFRKDGHPSIYRMEHKTEEEKIESMKHQDCSHWCLPGIPDTWNELLYVSLLKAGIGSWKKT